jgi:hypothetical protein
MYQTLIDQIENNIENTKRLLEIVRCLPELEGIKRTQPHDEKSVIVTMPYDYEMFRRNAETLKAAGWKQYGEINLSDDGVSGLITFYLGDSRWTGFVLSVHMHTDYEGATCKRSLLGYEQKPVYEITCLEA